MAKKPNGYILHETDQYVVIATGFAKVSANVKTGAMIQSWILVKAENPLSAVRSGHDSIVCFDCPMRSAELGERAFKTRPCYVNIGQAPLAIWKAYNRGSYPRIDPTAWYNGLLFKDRPFRFGSYGEPVLIPMPIVKAIAALASNFTGYTHQWRNPLFQGYRQYFMASTHIRDYQEAQGRGWRTFTVTPKNSTPLDKQVICPASAEAGHRVNCDTCGLCKGGSSKARSVQIQDHSHIKSVDI